MDNGNPKRGDSIQFNITFSSTCLDKAKVTIDASGNVYFSAPGYTISTYGKICLLCHNNADNSGDLFYFIIICTNVNY